MKKALATIGSAISYLAVAGTAFAQIGGVEAPDSGIKDIPAAISNGINIVLIIAGIIVFVYLVWAGLQWMTSGGDKGKVEEARSRITAALVGLAIVAAAYALSVVINNFFIGENDTSPFENIDTSHL